MLAKLSRCQVLSSFKKLHRTRIKVFRGDVNALVAARNKINDEYKKNKGVTDVEAVKTMVKFSREVEAELRTQVLQAREVKPGVFEVKITDDTIKLDNIPFNDAAMSDEGTRPCCQDIAKTK